MREICVHWRFRRLTDAVRRKRPEKWRTNIWFPLHDNAPAHRSDLVADWLAKTTVTTRISTDSSTEISIEEMAFLWCCWHHSECDGRAEKTFTKRLPGTFPTSLQSLAATWICTMDNSERKCSLNVCTVLCFSETKWFRVHLQAATYCITLCPRGSQVANKTEIHKVNTWCSTSVCLFM